MQHPTDDNKKNTKKEPKNTPDKDKKVDNQEDKDLKNIDQSKGGYGDDTGFDKE